MTSITEIRDQSNTVEFYEHDVLVQRMRVSAGTVRGLRKLYEQTAAYCTWKGRLTKIYLADKREAA